MQNKNLNTQNVNTVNTQYRNCCSEAECSKQNEACLYYHYTVFITELHYYSLPGLAKLRIIFYLPKMFFDFRKSFRSILNTLHMRWFLSNSEE